MIARTYEHGGVHFLDVAGTMYVLADEASVGTMTRWRGSRVVKVPSDGVGPARAQVRHATVFVDATGNVKSFTEGDHANLRGGAGPEMGEPERTWLDRQREAYEVEDSHA